MRVELIGAVAVTGGGRTVGDAALGGRRARVLLAALALADGSVTAEKLATLIWDDALPPTWPAALRGVVRSLRQALRVLDGDERSVIGTVPSGYRLSPDVEVDVVRVGVALREIEACAVDGADQATVDGGLPLTRLAGEQLLPGEQADWLEVHRLALDAVALRAAELVVPAAGRIREHHVALEVARRSLGTRPLDERAHRLLITALRDAGDRAGAVSAYESCRATLARELGVDPSADTVAAYLAAIQDDGAPRRALVPVVTTSFVGRGSEVAQLTEAARHAGLTTVVGRGGIGKSRLAQHVATTLHFEGGRNWVALGAVADDELVAGTVLLALGTGAGAADPTEGLVRRLAPLGRTLLVLDGCESALDGVASLLAPLIAGCPRLSVIATSRTPLGIDRERLLELAPLGSSDECDDLADSDQVQILMDRISDEGGELRLDGGNAPLVAALCRRCGGLPLALELAAAQLAVIPVGDLLEQLDLAAAMPTDQLRAMVLGSYSMLSPEEATVFRRLGVLDGLIPLPIVRAVVSGSDIAAVRVARILRELAARGLVSVDRSGPRWRYQQDDDLHRFARESLDEGDERGCFDRLAGALGGLLPEDATAVPGPFADEVTAVLAAVRSLFGAALDQRADLDVCLELAFRLHRYWAATTVAEGRFWLSRLLAQPGESPWRRHATYALGYLSYWSGDTEDAIRDLTLAVTMFGDEPDPFLARAYIYLAGLLDDLDRSAEAIDHVHRAMRAAQPFGTNVFVAAAMGLGSVLSEHGDPSAARHAAAAVDRCRIDGSPDQLAMLLPTAAMVCWQVGALDEARAYVAEARPLHSSGKRIARVVLLSAAAGLNLADDDSRAAIEDGHAAEDDARELGVERELPLICCLLAHAYLARGEGPAARDATRRAMDAAAAMSIVAPLALCLETAALVADGHGADSGALARVLAAASAIRARGDRPCPAPLAAGIAALRTRVADAAHGKGMCVSEAVTFARRLLADAPTGTR